MARRPLALPGALVWTGVAVGVATVASAGLATSGCKPEPPVPPFCYELVAVDASQFADAGLDPYDIIDGASYETVVTDAKATADSCPDGQFYEPPQFV